MSVLAINLPYRTFLKQIDDIPLLSRKEEHALAVKFYENNDLDAANKLVTSNLRFVVKIVSEYKSYGFPMMDLIQEGTIGLMHAVKKFNPYKGYRLISYAVWWIRARIHNHIMKFWSNVKIGTTQAQRKLFQKISGAKRKLNINSTKLEKKDLNKVAEYFGVKEQDVKEMELRMASRDFSLDSKVEGEDSINYIDSLADHAVNQEQILEDIETKSIAMEGIEKGLNNLSIREKKIVNERLLAENPKKLHELGDDLGISKERVRQIEKKAIMKLKKSVDAKLN